MTIDKLEEQYAKEVQASCVDGLTGLFNHGFFQIAMQMELERSNRYGTPFTLALIDIDDFSEYNISHGSMSGDLLLKQLALQIRQQARTSDVAARLNADRFALLLVETSAENALTVASRIQSAVKTLGKEKVSLSIGLASCPADSNNKGDLFRIAQEALLKAKSGSASKVCCYKKPAQEEDSKRSATVLVVDDELLNVKMLAATLIPHGYKILKAYNGMEAISIVEKESVDVVLLDVMMPGLDGFATCRRLKGSEESRMIPVVLVTALDSADAKLKGIEAGADDFITKPINKLELVARVKSLVRVRQLNRNLTSVESVLFSMASVVEAKDVYTEGHIQRVACLGLALGRKMGCNEEELEALRVGGVLHDIGKIGVPIEVLNKPGKLDPDEWEIMKSHSTKGYTICQPLKNSLGPALDIVRHHHEKLDGSGYPDGITAANLSIGVRIMAVVDIYDALVTDRPYRKAMDRARAFSILQEEAGQGKLDKSVVGCLIDMINKDPGLIDGLSLNLQGV